MRTARHALRLGIGGLLLANVLASPLASRAALAQDDHLRALYDDDQRFEQLSGAARNRLEGRFGRKPAPKEQSSAPVPAPAPAPAEPAAPIANILVNNPGADTTTRDTQSETSLVLTGSGVVVAFNDSGSSIGGNHFTGFSLSTDGGNTFTDRGALPASPEGDAGDPVLARSASTGTVFLATLGFTTGQNIQCFRSTDGGNTFGAPVNCTPGLAATDFQDKEWIAVDNFPGTGLGNVYLAWRQFPVAPGGGIRFTRSTDNGATWTPTGGALLAAEGTFNVQGAHVSVGPDHSVYVFWLDQSAGSGTPNIIRLRKSTDGGVTFGAPITVATLLGTAVNGDLTLNGGFRTNSFPQVAVNPVSGHLYVVYNDDVAGADRADVFLRRSTDGGATWSAATRLNTDATTNDQWQPTIAVTPDGSRLFASWYDRRRDPANALIDYFGVVGAIAGSTVTLGPNFRITTQSFPVVIDQDPAINPTYMGDYDQAVADNAFFYVSWGDNRAGNSFHANQPDIRLARIPVAGPTFADLLLVGAPSVTGGNGNNRVDPNECNSVVVTLINEGTTAAAGISAILSATTSGVSVTQPNSAYPDLAPGASAPNTTAFQLSTAPSFACGTTIDLKLTVATASDGVFVLPFQLATGGAGPAVRFDNTSPLAIPDVTTVESPITVSGVSGSVGKVTASLFITHTFDADLDIFLVAPDGTTVELTTDNGGAGANFGSSCADANRTVFDDAAATAITGGAAPFVGTFRPEGTLASLNGKNPNGTWKLRITDDFGGDVGTLNCWSLFVSPATCPIGGGICPLLSPNEAVITAAGSGGGPHVREFTGLGVPTLGSFFAYNPAFVGGVFSAGGDIDGSGGPKLVTGAGAGGGPHVRAFFPDGTPYGLELFAYDPSFTGGVRVAAGDVDGDGVDDIITGAGPGGGPHVRVFKRSADGSLSELAGFFAYSASFTGGVFVAAGDVNGDGRADIITGAGAGGGPHVMVFDRNPVTGGIGVLASFFAYSAAFTGGVSVAAGDVNGDGRADIITGAGAGGGPHVMVFSGANPAVVLASFFAYAPAFAGGVFVAGGDVNGDGRAEIITGPGAGGGPHVKVFDVTGGISELASFFAYDGAFFGGVRVGSGRPSCPLCP